MIFVKFNVDGTYGFYTPDFHGEEILSDPTYIEITKEAYDELMEHQGTKTIGEIEEGTTLIDSSFIIDISPQEPVPHVPTQLELLEEKVLLQEEVINELLFEIIPRLTEV